MDELCVSSGQKFLFISDSITDTGWRDENAPYGNGYVSLFMEMQRAMFPELKIVQERPCLYRTGGHEGAEGVRRAVQCRYGLSVPAWNSLMNLILGLT